jgi:acyl-CoA hydrolase
MGVDLKDTNESRLMRAAKNGLAEASKVATGMRFVVIAVDGDGGAVAWPDELSSSEAEDAAQALMELRVRLARR